MMRGVGPMAKLAGTAAGGRAGRSGKAGKGNRKKVKGGRVTPSSRGPWPDPLSDRHRQRREGHDVAVKLRLMRMGKKKQPTYRIVAADSRSPRDGRFIEIVGTYAPRMEPSDVEIDNAKALAGSPRARSRPRPCASCSRSRAPGSSSSRAGPPKAVSDRHARPGRAAGPAKKPAAKKATAPAGGTARRRRHRLRRRHRTRRRRRRRRRSRDRRRSRKLRFTMTDSGSNPFGEPDFSALSPSVTTIPTTTSQTRTKSSKKRTTRSKRRLRQKTSSMMLTRATRSTRATSPPRLQGRTRQPRSPRRAIAWRAARHGPCSSTSPARSSTTPRRGGRGRRGTRRNPAVAARRPGDMGRIIGRRGTSRRRCAPSCAPPPPRRHGRVGRHRRLTATWAPAATGRAATSEVGRIASRTDSAARWSSPSSPTAPSGSLRERSSSLFHGRRRRPGERPRTLEVRRSRPFQGRYLVRLRGCAHAGGGRRASRRGPSGAGGRRSRGALRARPDRLRGRSRTTGRHGDGHRVEANPASDLLVMDDGNLVPLRFVVDRAPGRIVVDVPAGLFE